MQRIVIRRERCKGCGLCIKFCKKKVLGLAKKVNAAGYYPVETVNYEECSGCTDCQIICADRAITVAVKKPPVGDGTRKED